MGDNYYKMIILESKWKNWHNLIDNTDIVKQIYNQEYWNALELIGHNEEDQKSSKIWIILLIIFIAVVILGIAGYYVYYKNFKKIAEECESIITT